MAAFHVGLSYFHPALPSTEPACKGSTDENYNHWVPQDFSPTAAALIELPTAGLALDVKVIFDTTLYIPLVIPHTKYTGRGQNDFNVHDYQAELAEGRPAVASERLVEVGLVTADKLGAVLPCVNWSGRPLPGLVVTLGFALPAAGPINASLASGAETTATPIVLGSASHQSLPLCQS
jgi:hypothetical protein